MKLPWYLRQTPAAVLVAGLGGLFTVAGTALAQSWGSTSPSREWAAVATSADGRTIVAAPSGYFSYSSSPAPIYVSTNAGGSWTETTAPSNGWACVACSADGLRFVAAAKVTGAAGRYYRGDGLIYTSSDAGMTWTPASPPTNHWTGIASSADGIRLVAVAAAFWDQASSNYLGEGAIYRSSNAGATWLRTATTGTNWTAVASSADGTKLVAVSSRLQHYDTNVQSVVYAGEGGIYGSLDSGVTWIRTSAPSMDWSCVASSADGVHLVAAAHSSGVNGPIYTSTDSGANWTQTSAPSTNWASVASSADGTKLVAGSASSGVYASSDAGATWTKMSSSGQVIGGAVACSADGYHLVAAGGQVCTWPYSGQWRLASALPNGSGLIACSADGMNLISLRSGFVYRSSDRGATWSQTIGPNESWSSIAISASGRLVAVSSSSYPSYNGGIYSSTNAGATWTRTSAPSNNWTSVASTVDGSNLVAVAAPVSWGTNYLTVEAAVYRSRDAGANWVRTSAPSNYWRSVASSADGTRLVAVAAGFFSWDSASGNYIGEGAIYRSSDAGATWLRTAAPSTNWAAVASSADGTNLVAVSSSLVHWDTNLQTYVYTGGAIYHSSDAGTTWVRTTAPSDNWRAVTSSGDGTTFCAVRLGSLWGTGFPLEISTNSGASWAPSGVPAGFWNSVTASADGSTLVVAEYGQVATLHSPFPAPPSPPSPQLAIGRPSANLGLSWLVTSTPFVLQTSSGLRSPDWMAVPTSPTLNLTNLHYQLTLPGAPGAAFYRLKQQ